MDTDLRQYLQCHQQLTWKEKMKINVNIIDALNKVHREDAIHRDLHSGNILYLQSLDTWYISDLGFSGPADKPLKCIYGNLPYVAPEVIAGKGYTKASDVYSLAMLMWEISFEKSPFNEYENDYDLAIKIVNGMRPKITSGIPLEYKNLMEQCWNADPSQRPDIYAIKLKIFEMNKLYYESDEKKKINYDVNWPAGISGKHLKKPIVWFPVTGKFSGCAVEVFDTTVHIR
ncbi:14264_t:CDS:2 [Funneliformis geosporum]|uniref:14264_t:CDS:1 n=1 Tax=Funneliformis geosporum TaxID=1117311 RepID=A0A9W4WL69_9GLOM|nr:14264_t:CDS:2 [Funneliformis geosporum]